MRWSLIIGVISLVTILSVATATKESANSNSFQASPKSDETNYESPDQFNLSNEPTIDQEGSSTETNDDEPEQTTGSSKITLDEKQRFVVEVLKLLHEQYAAESTPISKSAAIPDSTDNVDKKSDSNQFAGRQASMNMLLGALGADGDLRRLIDWAQNSFNVASIGEIATQFVVSKLGSVNCNALFKPDAEETLIPRFLLFNEHFVDVPFELTLQPSSSECLVQAKFDPRRKTVILIHGFLTGYTLVDGMTNIKNRLLDINRSIQERAIYLFERAASSSNGSYVLSDADIESAIKQHQYNVIIVDWFNGANPVPRSNYIKSAVNAQVVGKLIARFLSTLTVRCATPSSNLQIIAHSLGCHVAGFTGKAMNSLGHRLGKITHLDPVGLCFGRLFSEPKLRLNPDDAIETQAVHVSLNLFDNPLDGAQANFLVNGGRDQVGCGGQSELKNSTTSSLSLLFDSEAGFMPCSHLRALALYEDDLSSRPAQCQIVGYRCASYDKFLSGKCGHCDSMNNQCRLMSLPPISSLNFRKVSFPVPKQQGQIIQQLAASYAKELYSLSAKPNGSKNQNYANEIKRQDRQLPADRLTKALDKLKVDARNVIAEGWTSLSGSQSDRKGLIGGKLSSLHKYASKANKTDESTTTTSTVESSDDNSDIEATASRFQADNPDVDLVSMPLGGQKPPAGSLLGPLYYLGTGAVTPYCVNYYQFRLLIAESRIERLIQSNSLAPNRLGQIRTQNVNSIQSTAQRLASTSRNILHLTIKLTDSFGHFFKGFTIKEDAKQLVRVPSDTVQIGQQAVSNKGKDNLVEVTMLLNTTSQLEPVRISESIVSYYFHGIVLADRIEINYMSNISPE